MTNYDFLNYECLFTFSLQTLPNFWANLEYFLLCKIAILNLQGKTTSNLQLFYIQAS